MLVLENAVYSSGAYLAGHIDIIKVQVKAESEYDCSGWMRSQRFPGYFSKRTSQDYGGPVTEGTQTRRD